MHGIGGTQKEDPPGMWPSSLTTPIKQINSRVCMSQISKEPSAVSRPKEGGPLSLNHFGNLCSSINMLTLDKSLMTTMPSHQHIWSQLPLVTKQKSQSTSPHQANRGRCEPMVNGCLPGRNMKVLSVMHTHTHATSLPDIGHMLSASLGQSHQNHK